MIRRDKVGSLQSAVQAGVTNLKKFKLSIEVAFALRSQVPLDLWRLVKRTLQENLGVSSIYTGALG